MLPRKMSNLALQKSHAKPKDTEVNGVELFKCKHAPETQWSKNPHWTYALIKYLGDHVVFRLKLFSDLTADVTWEGCLKHTAKDSDTLWTG
jgi:hypothetical protein